MLDEAVIAKPAARVQVKRFPRRAVLAGIIIAAAALLIWRVFFSAPPLPDNLVALSGRIEGDDSAIATKQAGRINDIRVREGDRVAKGSIIATLDDAQARAALNDARAKWQAAGVQIAVLQAQLRRAQLSGEQATVDVEGRISQANGELAAAQAQVSQAGAAYRLAATTARMDRALYATGDVSQLQRNASVSQEQQTAAALTAANRRMQAAQGALTAARAGLANPPMRIADVAAVQAQLAQQRSIIAATQAELKAAQANVDDLTVRAPFAGTVMVRAAEPGEVVPAGTPIVTLLNLDRVYLRGFVPEGEIGRVKVGQTARIRLDSDRSHAIEAYVMRIDPQAMFTPQNTYFRSDRVKQVFGVKLALRRGFGYAKPGMPADGEILVSGTWPK